MLKKLLRPFTILCLLALYLLGVFFVQPRFAMAALGQCSAVTDRHTIAPLSQAEIQMTITNTDINNIRWLQITRPFAEISIVEYGVAGWNSSLASDGSSITLNFGSLAPGESLDLSLLIESGSNAASSANWIVEASDLPDGFLATGCSGDLSLSVGGAASDNIPPVISGVTLSKLSSSSVTISWTTSEATSGHVAYGPSSSYGSLKTSKLQSSTTHTVELQSLKPNTGYHYQIEASDAAGNASVTNNNTFLTPISVTANPTTSIFAPVSPATQGEVDAIVPSIELAFNPNNPYKVAPVFSGTASDNDQLASIEYSLDGGLNWLVVEDVLGLGTRRGEFQFQPENLDDGNYDIVVRAIDIAGNQAVTEPLLIVIDQHPPTLGSTVFSVGPQVIVPADNGELVAMTGIDQKLTLGASGGATSIDLTAAQNGRRQKQTFSLVNSPETGLWTGIMSFNEPGSYYVTIKAVDGAANVLEQELIKIRVVEPGYVKQKGADKFVSDATTTLFYMNSETRNWVLWDGQPYGQSNPQTTTDSGEFRLFVPAGTYYVKVSKKGYKTTSSQILHIKSATPLDGILDIERGFGWWPSKNDLRNSQVAGQKNTSHEVVGQSMPLMNFSVLNAPAPVHTVSLYGKPTLVTLLSSWVPGASEQLPVLRKLAENDSINILPVALLENEGKVSAYARRAGYDKTIAIDPRGEFGTAFNTSVTPVHYFLDRRGDVKTVKYGVLLDEEIMQELNKIK